MGNTNYIDNRPDHYRVLEKWLDEDKKDSRASEEKRKDALISLKELINGGTSHIEKNLEQFEVYVMCAINGCSMRWRRLLEKWLDEDKRDSGASEVTRNKAASLTEDSCFSAQVEEALISLKELIN
ncbi:hypothetical protein L1987_19400 [Smallanthus sonchifolius]|uniref:Uncharacterized protein n=1 Tax=Smallanthus sonchifolius TaxID=185202 RepID=A0ACB9IQP4_9ASTR|nr:hypothetical protein L1987_19400 [Smallanthus sonchifolius]